MQAWQISPQLWVDVQKKWVLEWPVASRKRRFANFPFANVLSRFAYETKRALYMYITRSFYCHDTETFDTHVYIHFTSFF